jgi:hypothetical protein
MSPNNAVAHIVDGKVELELPRSKVVILGAHPLGRATVPWDDPEFEIWGLNLVPCVDTRGRFRADRWFEMHEIHAQTDDDLEWIRQCPVPMYVPPGGLRDWPGGRKMEFPLQRLEEKFAVSYWACSFAYQMALAIDEGFSHISMHGIELAEGTARERSVEMANVAYWVGRAHQAGITVDLPEGGLTAQHPWRYGVEYTEEKDFVDGYVHSCWGTWDTSGMRGAEDGGGEGS